MLRLDSRGGGETLTASFQPLARLEIAAEGRRRPHAREGCGEAGRRFKKGPNYADSINNSGGKKRAVRAQHEKTVDGKGSAQIVPSPAGPGA